MTGITVGSEMIPEQQQRQKAVIEFNSGNPSFDVIALSYHVQKRQFAKNNWLDRPAADDRRQVAGRSEPRFRRFRARAASIMRRGRRPRRSACRSTSTRGSSITTRSCSTPRASRIPKTFAEMIDAAAQAQRSGKGVSGFVGTRPQECQRAGVDELPARLRRRLHRRERQADDRHARGDRSGEDVPDAARQVRPAGCRRLQLERVAEPVPAGQGGDVARRHRLRAAARGSDQVARRRQGRLRRDARRARSSRSRRCSATAKAFRRFSKKKGPSWFYLQWASNKANQTRMLQAAAGAPVRNSAYAAAQASADFKAPKEWVECMLTSARDRAAGPAGHRAGDRVPRHVRHRADQHDQRRRSGGRTEEGDGRVPAGARQERESLTATPAPSETTCAGGRIGLGDERRSADARTPRPASSPGAGGAICCSSCRRWSSSARSSSFPWLFTLWMSAFDWKIGSAAHFVGFDNYTQARRPTSASRVDRPHVLLHRCSR